MQTTKMIFNQYYIGLKRQQTFLTNGKDQSYDWSLNEKITIIILNYNNVFVLLSFYPLSYRLRNGATIEIIANNYFIKNINVSISV